MTRKRLFIQALKHWAFYVKEHFPDRFFIYLFAVLLNAFVLCQVVTCWYVETPVVRLLCQLDDFLSNQSLSWAELLVKIRLLYAGGWRDAGGGDGSSRRRECDWRSRTPKSDASSEEWRRHYERVEAESWCSYWQQSDCVSLTRGQHCPSGQLTRWQRVATVVGWLRLQLLRVTRWQQHVTACEWCDRIETGQ